MPFQAIPMAFQYFIKYTILHLQARHNTKIINK